MESASERRPRFADSEYRPAVAPSASVEERPGPARCTVEVALIDTNFPIMPWDPGPALPESSEWVSFFALVGARAEVPTSTRNTCCTCKARRGLCSWLTDVAFAGSSERGNLGGALMR